MQYEYLARVGTRYLGGIISAESRKQAVRLIRMACRARRLSPSAGASER